MLTLIKIVPDREPDADGRWIRLPDRLDLGPRWVDHEAAVAPYVPDGWRMVALESPGREYDYAFTISWLHDLLYSLAWPTFECQLCLGQEEWRGCECVHKDAVAPGVGPEPWRLWARRLWSVVARRCGLYDPYERSW